MLGEAPEATYAALLQTYAPRNPLREFGHGLIDINTLRIMIEHLPLDSAMHRAIPASRGWLPADHLAALQVDVLQATWELLRTANSEDHTYDPPPPIDRPGAAEQRAAQEAADARNAAAQREWASHIESIVVAHG